MDRNISKASEQIILPSIKKKKPYYYLIFVAAFVGAVLLWFYAIGYDSTIFEREINNIPVKIVGAEELSENKKFSVADELDMLISVTVSGRRTDLYELNDDDIEATVDVSQVETAGEATLPIQVKIPNGITVTEMKVQTVSLFIDEFLIKTVPVNAVYGNYVLSDGLKLGETNVNPVVVTIEGPATEINRISAAYVDVALGNISSPISAYGSIYLKYDDGSVVSNKYVKLAANQAYVYIDVYKEKTVPIKVQFIGGVFSVESAVIKLSRETLTISGSIDIVNSINQVTLKVDETGLNMAVKNTITEYYSSLLPAGVTNESGEALLTAEIKIPDITTKYFFIPSAQIKGVSDSSGKTVKAGAGVTVTVVGSRDVLKGMTVRNITASVSAENVFRDEKENEVAYVDFTFNDITGVYVWGSYIIKVTTQEAG